MQDCFNIPFRQGGDEAPQLPSGYSAMLLLALIPPLWRRVMDARVLDFYRGDIRLAALKPGVRV